MKTTTSIQFSLLLMINICFEKSVAQAPVKFNARFTADSMRIIAGPNKSVDTALAIIIPKGAGSLLKGKVLVKAQYVNSLELKTIKASLSDSFPIDTSTDSLFSYPVSFKRDLKDDRFIRFALEAYDSTGKRVALADKDSLITVYIKPVEPDSLSTHDNWEFWLFTGTNFDPFDGIRAQEFFFRANALFKIAPKIYGQIAFYKNRYFTIDSSINNKIFQPATPPLAINGTDTSYRYITGSYQRNTSQKTDPLGLQLDVLYKLTKSELPGHSNFFLTGGFDFNTRKTTLTFKFEYDTSAYSRSTRVPRDTTMYNLPLSVVPFSFQTAVYNLNVGLMWILDEAEVNLKAQLTAGYSHYSNPIVSYSVTRNGTNLIGFNEGRSYYLQMRMFATAKKIGLSMGFESFIRKDNTPQFNFTLSKVFELKHFVSLFSPVSSISK